MKEMSKVAEARLKEFNDTAIWHGKCPKCGATVKGTLAQLRAHRCDDDPNPEPDATA